jgi:hypothetical protein
MDRGVPGEFDIDAGHPVAVTEVLGRWHFLPFAEVTGVGRSD